MVYILTGNLNIGGQLFLLTLSFNTIIYFIIWNCIYWGYKHERNKSNLSSTSGRANSSLQWTSRKNIYRSQKNPNRHNIALSWYALRDPKPTDSIFVLEPMCVNPSDYGIEYLKNFKHIFAWTKKAFENTPVFNKVIEVNHPNLYKFPNPDVLINQWKPWEQRQDKLIIIANDKTSKHPSNIYKLRMMLANNLHKACKYKVEWYGQKPPKKPYRVGPVKDKLELLRNVKFTICSENCYHPKYSYNYFTEKMMHAWMAGTVPLYMGCHNIDQLFPKEAYIDLRPYVKKNGHNLQIDFPTIKNIINSFSKQDYEKMIKAIKEIIKSPEGLFHICSWQRVHLKMLETIK
ncbi:MAG: hypothetical protein HC877_22490 [Thioploca sp.]|nr:hypothetical protein [Thioploca sp.]